VASEQIVLPQAGSLELLPTYENHTNRYLGDDGVDYVPNCCGDGWNMRLIASPKSG